VGVKPSLILLSLWLSGCSAIEEYQTLAPIPTPTPTYSCIDVGKYDSLLDCNQGTLAVCQSSKEVLPNGGLVDCYSAVSGGELCIQMQSTVNRPVWIYGAGIAWCKTTPGTFTSAGYPFKQTRNLVACSSSTCLCLDPLDTTSGITCNDQISCTAFQFTPTGSEPCCDPTDPSCY
jgi:hypothetical protein